MTQIERVVNVAVGELGYTEQPPHSNRTKYGIAYGIDGVRWCVIFLWWVFTTAGLGKLFFGGGKTASCLTLGTWYALQGWVVPVSEIRAGDIVLLDFLGSGEAQHCGLVIEGPKNASNYFYTVEGNTTPGTEGSQDNGGCVARKARHIANVVSVLRPQYQNDVPNDWEGRWSTEAIVTAMHDGVLVGYPDGSFKPEQSVTREELAAFYVKMKNKGMLK